jgi:hypothetical protein
MRLKEYRNTLPYWAQPYCMDRSASLCRHTLTRSSIHIPSSIMGTSGVRHPERETHQPPTCTVQAKMCGALPPAPLNIFTAWCLSTGTTLRYSVSFSEAFFLEYLIPNTFGFKYFQSLDNRRESSVGLAARYKLYGRGVGVRFLAGARDFPLLHSTQPGSGAHPGSYLMGTWGSFPGGKAAGAWR